MKRFLSYVFFLILFPLISIASEPLPANQAFQFSATAKDYQTILLMWHIAPNFYLYQKHFSFTVIKPTDAQLGEPLYPSNTETLKTNLGSFLVYSGDLTIPIPIIQSNEKNIILRVNYQGCSKAGYCYPPTTKIVSINLAGNYMQPVSALEIDVAPINENHTVAKTSSNYFTGLFDGHSFWLLILGFFGFGILLSLTPCVLPMIPILSSMILGREKMSHIHAFFLSLFYVLGTALCYAMVGILFGQIGKNIQIIFQEPWVIIAFSIIFVGMALSLFGLFQIQLPEKLRSTIANTSHHQKSGTYIGAFVMGILSTLILSPCVTPPLVAALGYISQSGNAAEGGAALFFMGIGMGLPLLVIGALGPKFLPKSGAWMNGIKNFLGFLLIAVAITMLSRVFEGQLIVVLWGVLSLCIALFLGALSTATTRGMMVKKAIGIVFFVSAILLMSGAYRGDQSPLSILKTPLSSKTKTLNFHSVHSLNQIQKALDNKHFANKPILLDFYANWCLSCKEFDEFTLKSTEVQKALRSFVLLRVDITDNTAENQLIEQHYGVIAPPTLLFFKNNQEIVGSRVVGFQSAKQFHAHLMNLLSSYAKN